MMGVTTPSTPVVAEVSMPKRSAYMKIPYLLLFAVLSAWGVLQPEYTWDLLGYVGSATKSTDVVVIHDAALNALHSVRPTAELQADMPYRVDMVANPYHFAEQLPFYSIKPIYVALIQGLHREGLPFPRATVTISAVSNFALAVILWLWLTPYLNGLPTAVACTLIMLSPNILVLSRWATPDCLATAVAALGLYLILERKRFFWGSAILVFDIWIRTDGLILAGLVFVLLLFLRKLDFWQAASLSLTALASYFAINHFGGNYGWSALFYNSFLGGIVAPGEMLVHISLAAYLHQLVRGTYMWFTFGAFPLYMLLGGLAVWLNRYSIYSYVIVTVLGARILSYLFYPNGDQRYTAVLFVLVPVALVIAVGRNNERIENGEVISTKPTQLRELDLAQKIAATGAAIR
jgi:hypothetical protein